jgi:hypothetical protein
MWRKSDREELLHTWRTLRPELREMVWLASIVSGLSIVGVGLAVAAVLVLDR